jgi:hypothetical protein
LGLSRARGAATSGAATKRAGVRHGGDRRAHETPADRSSAGLCSTAPRDAKLPGQRWPRKVLDSHLGGMFGRRAANPTRPGCSKCPHVANSSSSTLPCHGA